MKKTTGRFTWVCVFCALGILGCWPQKNETVEKQNPKVTAAERPDQPKLVTHPPKTMDLISSQNSPGPILSAAAASPPRSFFFIQPQPTTEAPTERNGSKFEHAIKLNGKILTLRGVTVRKYEMSSISLLTIYSVGLYLPEGVDVSGPIPDVEKVLILEYHLNVPKEKVVQAIRESVHANPEVSAPLVETNFQKLSDAFDSPLKGDRYEFPYIPGQGTAMIKSRKIMTRIHGRHFEQAFFGIWLSPHGNDQQMRCELLALPCPEKSLLNPVNAISSSLGEAKNKLGKLKGLIS